jgi:hypothetical protein
MHGGHQGKAHQAGASGTCGSASDGIAVHPAWNQACGQTGHRSRGSQDGNLRPRLFLAHSPMPLRQSCSSHQHGVLADKAIRNGTARQTQDARIAEGWLAGFGNLGMQNEECGGTGKALKFFIHFYGQVRYKLREEKWRSKFVSDAK